MSMEKINNFIRSGVFSGPKPGYKFQDGYKGVGYYMDDPAPPAPSTDKSSAMEAPGAWSVKCVDGTLDLTQDEAAYLQTANLPTGMLPSATVRQVLDAAATVIAAASANGDYDEQKEDASAAANKENEKKKKEKKLKKKKKKKTDGPVVFPSMDERVRDKDGYPGTVRYIGTVHTSKVRENELNFYFIYFRCLFFFFDLDLVFQMCLLYKSYLNNSPSLFLSFSFPSLPSPLRMNT